MTSDMRHHLIELRKISRVFAHQEIRTYALNEASLKCDQGDFIAVTGPSGSGKSTLLSVMGLLDERTGGEILVDGALVADDGYSHKAAIRRNNFGFVFQGYHLVSHLSVIDNVILPLSFRREVPGHVRKEMALEALASVGMAHRAGHYPGQLSGGQQQRVAMARALVCKPRVIFADEPTGNLDQANGDMIMELLWHANSQGTAVVLVTHDMRYTSGATEIVQMRDGRLLNAQAGEQVPLC